MTFHLRLLFLILVGIVLTLGCDSGHQDQRALGTRSVNIIEGDQAKFKDLNKNGKLDPYEDWRLSYEDRSRDLIARMTLEEKAGLMLISTTRLENDWSFERGKNTGKIASGFNEEDLVSAVNIFTREELPHPMLSAAGTTKAVTKFHERHFIVRSNPPTTALAEWSNNLQALCERDGLGIPATITSNPRNHIANEASLGLTLGQTSFTTWPGELGLAAMRDLELTYKFADYSRQEWKAVGIRKGYMYMADLATEPRWQRTEGTFGEDAQLAADMIRQIVLGFQGQELHSQSVALTTKHFPGGGATEGGQDPHFHWGKREVFPGGMFENNLIPFQAAIDAGTSAIMPYYSYPVGTSYDELAYAFNREILQDLLRDRMGFDGIINSDTGPIEMMPWGVEALSVVDRYKLALESGVNIFSGSADPTKLIETLEKYPALLPLVDESVHRLLLEKFRLGLFEDPYVDVALATSIVGHQDFQESADLALRKSIVHLRNDAKSKASIPLQRKTKVYFETHQLARGEPAGSIFNDEENRWDLQFVASAEEADVVLLWLFPKGKSLFASDGSPLHVSLSANGIDTDYINALKRKKPTVLVVNYSNPWAIDEVYRDGSSNIKSVLATFGTTYDALLDVVTGKFVASGRMPFSTPISNQAAIDQKSDVPGYAEGADYALFHFDEGL